MLNLSGGMYGVGLIVDGLIDVAFTIKAAINGEYVNLNDFFINKAISLAIMALSFGASALITKFGPAIGKIAGKLGGKFLSTAVGGAAKSLFKFGRSIWRFGKKLVLKAWRGVKSLGKWVWTKLKNIGQKFLNMMKRIGVKLKLDKAFKKIASLISKIKSQLSRLATMKSGKYFWEPFVKRVTPETVRAKQANYILRLIAKESARRGVLEGIDWAVNKQLLPKIRVLLVSAIKEKVTDYVTIEMNGDSGKAMERYVGSATGKTGYMADHSNLVNLVRSIIDSDFLTINDRVMANVFRAFKSIGGDISKTLMNQFKNSSTATKLGLIIEKYSNSIIELARGSVAANNMLTYTRGLFKRFRDKVDQDPIKKDPPPESYIRSEEGKKLFDEDKKKMIVLLSDHIANQLVNLLYKMPRLFETFSVRYALLRMRQL